jgi:hypothetical protein
MLRAEPFRTEIDRSFVCVNVDVGEFNRNLDVARSLGVDVIQGIPAAASLRRASDQPSSKRSAGRFIPTRPQPTGAASEAR